MVQTLRLCLVGIGIHGHTLDGLMKHLTKDARNQITTEKINKEINGSFEDDEFKYLDQLWSVLDNCDLTKKVTKGDVIEWYKIVVECRDSIGTYDLSSDDGFVKLFKKCFDNGLFRGGVNSEAIKKFLCKN